MLRIVSASQVGAPLRRGERQRRRFGRSVSGDGSLVGSASTCAGEDVVRFVVRHCGQALPITEPVMHYI